MPVFWKCFFWTIIKPQESSYIVDHFIMCFPYWLHPILPHLVLVFVLIFLSVFKNWLDIVLTCVSSDFLRIIVARLVSFWLHKPFSNLTWMFSFALCALDASYFSLSSTPQLPPCYAVPLNYHFSLPGTLCSTPVHLVLQSLAQAYFAQGSFLQCLMLGQPFLCALGHLAFLLQHLAPTVLKCYVVAIKALSSSVISCKRQRPGVSFIPVAQLLSIP